MFSNYFRDYVCVYMTVMCVVVIAAVCASGSSYLVSWCSFASDYATSRECSFVDVIALVVFEAVVWRVLQFLVKTN